MGTEIERKFLVAREGWRSDHAIHIRQGYLSLDPDRTVRVRVAGDQARLTIKGPTTGISRSEYEYDIPLEDGLQLLDLCRPPLIEKWRHTRIVGGHTWEIDEFSGENAGLVLAEVELSDETETFSAPGWLGREVSADPRYYNASLAVAPFRSWGAPKEPGA